MPRIARIITRLNLGGPARQILAMTPALAREGFETHILCGHSPPGEGDLSAEISAAGAQIHRIPALVRDLSLMRDRRAFRHLRAHLRYLAPDLVHTHTAKAGWLGRRAALRERLRPLVHTFHGHLLQGYFGRVLARVYKNIERRLSRRTDRLVCVSLATLEDLVAAGVIAPERSGVIRPGIDLRPFETIARKPFEDGKPTLLFMGRLVAVKRPERFLDLVAELRQRGRDVRALVLGDGPLRPALEKRAAALVRSGAVEFLGLDAHPAAVLERADLLVSTSQSEGLPVAIIEALAAGRAVVAMDAGGIGEVLHHERDGLLVPEGAVGELRRATERLLDERDLALALGGRGRVKVTASFGAERLAREHLELYRHCLAEAGAR